VKKSRDSLLTSTISSWFFLARQKKILICPHKRFLFEKAVVLLMTSHI